MKVLVTGGAGFIGSHLVDGLIDDGHTVLVLDDLSSGSVENLPPGCSLEVADIRDRDAVAMAVSGKDVVFHLAAFTSVPESFERPEICRDINVNATCNLLEEASAAGVAKVVFASSSAVYSDQPELPKAESEPLGPSSPYGESKLEGERLLHSFLGEAGLKYTALRFFNVYGTRQRADSSYASVVPLFIQSALARRPLTIYADGLQTRDFIYVRDVVRANMMSMQRDWSGVLNVGTGIPISIGNLASKVLQLTGSASELRFAPTREGDVQSSTADASLASQVLDWRSEYMLEDGLREVIRWHEASLAHAEKGTAF